MYKKLTFDELISYQTHFFENLKSVMYKEKTEKLSDFLKIIFRHGQEIYYFNGNQPIFRFCKINANEYVLYDEQERVYLTCSPDDINKIHNLLKQIKTKTTISTKNMLDTLIDEFTAGSYRTIQNHKYLVYDIETPMASQNLTKLPFALGYVAVSDQYKTNFQANYIEKNNLKKFVDFVLDFDGLIVGYNNIGFDNQVIAYNVGYNQEHIDIINAKSLDLFQFMYNLTGKRIGLNKLSTALIGLKKTLTGGGSEGTDLLKQYEETGDMKALTKLKEYCKNDVKMTLGVLLYMLKFGKIQTEEGEYIFDHQKLIDLSQQKETNIQTIQGTKKGNMFDIVGS